MAISYVGNMKLNGYRITNTLSGSCNGSIIGANISASTNSAPYLVSWSGTNTLYTANTFDISNLCADNYAELGKTMLALAEYLPIEHFPMIKDEAVRLLKL